MSTRLLAIAIEKEHDIVQARQRTRQIAALLGFVSQDQTRITTAVSEIARNAIEYGKGGRIEYRLVDKDAAAYLEIVVRDAGPGIKDIDGILDGLHRSTTGMGIGVLGARRLMDAFAVETAPGRGTKITMTKRLPRAALVSSTLLAQIGETLAKDEALDPIAEIRRQNQEMLVQLEELNDRQQQLAVLNEELQDTNRGVVALYAELNDRADHLRQADELKSRFLSNMSHEFRTPLNSILALTRLLASRADGDLAPEQTKQVQFIQKAAESLTELVNDLLDLAKVEAGRTVVAPIEFTAADLFSTLRGMLRPLLVGDAVALIFDPPPEMPAMRTDESKVSQILRNFISNALKFTEQGEVRVTASFDADTDGVTFAVSDTGIGIAESDIEIIWQEFGQVAGPLQAKVKGTGLGLPLSKKLAELLGGSVAANSAVGRGSRFALTLPRVFPLSGDRAELDPDWIVDPNRIPILAIDDDPAAILNLERILDGTRYQLLAARSTAQGKRALERITPGAIILDIMLEGEEAWRFLIDTKHRDATHSIPFIVVTNTRDERKARSLGADQYFDKPIDHAHLLQVLDDLTGTRATIKVLLVDDEEIARYLARQLLPRGAFYLREAGDALTGLSMVRKEKPDVIILDLNMKPIDGLGFLELLASEAPEPLPPVVILTSQVPDDTQKLIRAGATVIMSKSELTGAALVSAVRRALDAEERVA
ncbi:MAG TPA: ATP-binding protein [Stellaceae bacterium]|jgi:signal transduction histidine kinase/CheY-like chemotaxis protein